jgi:hypothetical protein
MASRRIEGSSARERSRARQFSLIATILVGKRSQCTTGLQSPAVPAGCNHLCFQGFGFNSPFGIAIVMCLSLNDGESSETPILSPTLTEFLAKGIDPSLLVEARDFQV